MSPTTTKSLHAARFPGEPDQYRRARERLLQDEVDLRRRIEAVAEQRRKLPLGGLVPDDYVFEEWDTGTNSATPVRLSELFDIGKDTLFLYSFMFSPGKAGLPLEEGCPVCTSIIDGIDGAVPHITQQINFAVVAKVPIEQFHEHAKTRGWRHARLLSSAHTNYNRDYYAEGPDGQTPMATVFTRRDGKIHHFWSSEMRLVPPDTGQDARHVDFMWPLWAVLDRTPDGRDPGWSPELEYSAKG